MPKLVAYFDCFSGASGDMLLGGLLDAGLDLDALRGDLALMPLCGYELVAEHQVRRGIAGTKFDVAVEDETWPARHLGDVRELLTGSDLPDIVVQRAIDVFTRLAEAEASVHGTGVEEVHFHEVGAVDAVVDIVGFCCGVHRLGFDALYASALPLGRGTVQTEHGRLPVPAPATLALIAEARTPVIPSPAEGELVTPTGAALLTTLATFTQPAMRLERVGYGFGSKEFPWANALRVWIGEEMPGQGGSAGNEGHLYGHHHHAHHEHEHDDDHG